MPRFNITSTSHSRKLPDQQHDESHRDIDEVQLDPALLDRMKPRQGPDHQPRRGHEESLAGHVTQVLFKVGFRGEVPFGALLVDARMDHGREQRKYWLRE